MAEAVLENMDPDDRAQYKDLDKTLKEQRQKQRRVEHALKRKRPSAKVRPKKKPRAAPVEVAALIVVPPVEVAAPIDAAPVDVAAPIDAAPVDVAAPIVVAPVDVAAPIDAPPPPWRNSVALRRTAPPVHALADRAVPRLQATKWAIQVRLGVRSQRWADLAHESDDD